MSKDPQNIDQLRERLRALGYLDARVDRYVLGSAASGTGRARFALAAGLRVGIAAGLMLGVSAAVVLAARAPGFISSRRDAVILALALSAVFAVISAAAVAATVLAASWYAGRAARLTPRRAHQVATAAGILVALGSAAYLALWWNGARDVLTSLTFGWHAAALAVAAATALLLAHAVSVVILAALARAGDASDIAAGGLLSSRAFLAGFGVLLFAGSAAFVSMGGSPRDASAAAPITVVPAGHAMRVIAIDGFDRRLSARLELPALSRLMRGARVPLDRGSDAPDPARDWTTLATGQPAARHGIASLEGRRALGIDGRLPQARGAAVETLFRAADLLRLTTPAIASGDERRDPAFWEVAAAAGLRTAVVNWWATWPAPAGDDIVITDRALLRLDTGGELDAEIAPASLYPALRASWQTKRQRAEAAALAEFGSIADPDLRAVMVRSAEIDWLTAFVAASVAGSPQVGGPLDLLVVYLPGLDIAQHQLLQRSGPASVSAMSERVAALERYYRFLDTLVAMLLPPSETHLDAAILWPGRVAAREGALMIAGAAVTGGETCRTCTDVGAAATLLYLLGLPIAEDLGSTVAVTVISDAFARTHGVRRVPSYRGIRSGGGARTGQPLDAEALERLRSLGYIR
jgi:hypothetical protein